MVDKRNIFITASILLFLFSGVFAITFESFWESTFSSTFGSLFKKFFSFTQNDDEKVFSSDSTGDTISCSPCMVGNCECMIPDCDSGILNFYSNSECAMIPDYSMEFSSGTINWSPVMDGEVYYLRAFCSDGFTKSDCVQVNIGQIVSSSTTLTSPTLTSTTLGSGSTTTSTYNTTMTLPPGSSTTTTSHSTTTTTSSGSTTTIIDCQPGLFCDGDWKYQKNPDCSNSNWEYCTYGCQNGVCAEGPMICASYFRKNGSTEMIQGTWTINPQYTSSIHSCFNYMKKNILDKSNCAQPDGQFITIILIPVSRHTYDKPDIDFSTEFVHSQFCEIATTTQLPVTTVDYTTTIASSSTTINHKLVTSTILVTTTTSIPRENQVFKMTNMECNKNKCDLQMSSNTIDDDVVLFVYLKDEKGKIYYISNPTVYIGDEGSLSTSLTENLVCSEEDDLTDLTVLVLAYRKSNFGRRIGRLRKFVFTC